MSSKTSLSRSAPTATPSWAIGVAFHFPENRRMRFPPVTPCTSALSHPLRRYCRLEHEISSGQSATILVATRVVLLAQWLTDVLAGLGLGVAVERVIRCVTKPTPIH